MGEHRLRNKLKTHKAYTTEIYGDKQSVGVIVHNTWNEQKYFNRKQYSKITSIKNVKRLFSVSYKL